jgi:hypothetical protein
MKVLLLHGLHSRPGGAKANAIEGAGHELINPALPADSWEESLRIAQEAVDEHSPDAIVGSSRGGALAVNVDSNGAHRVLIAPAWSRFGSVTTVPSSTVILHSPDDDIVLFEDSEELAKRSKAQLIAVGNDHRMNDPETLRLMLEYL